MERVINTGRGLLSAFIIFSLIVVLCPIGYPAEAKKSKEDQSRIEEVSDEKSDDTPAESPEAIKAKDEKKSPKETKEKSEEVLYNFEKPAAAEESYGWMIFKTIIILGALVGGFYYFFRFVSKRAGVNVLGREAIQILSVVPIGPNKHLQVVDVAGRVLILGVSDGGINLITEIREKEDIDRIRMLSSKSAPLKTEGFHEYLSRNVDRIFKRVRPHVKGELREGPRGDSDRLDYLKRQRERLKNLNGMNDE
jgi:flagellar protein FliO/FliZ